MPVVIPDDVLQETGLTERELLIEVACRLFDIDKLPLWPAAKLAGLTRMEMQEELRKRNIAIIRIDDEYWAQEIESLKHLESLRRSEASRD